jgi:hypothetical protein
LTEDNRTVGYFIPKASAAEEDDDTDADNAGANGSGGEPTPASEV